MDKQTVREEIKTRRGKANQREITKNNKEIVSHISVSRMFLEGKVIMAFLPTADEVNIDPVLQLALSSGKILCVPRILDKEGNMEAAQLTAMKQLPRDEFDIRTVPEPYEVIAPEDIDLVLVPGMSFTQDGSRLGKGKGFYDRFLPRCTKAKTLGVAYEFQVVRELPLNAHDIKVNYLVTEKALRVCK